MSEFTKIEWCDHTFNPWIGCTKVSPGCANCYAENQGKGKPRKRTSPANWKKPLKWNKQAEKEGIRYRVFCASLADWLDEEVPIEWLYDLIKLIANTPHLDWLLLTKRPEKFSGRLGLTYAKAHTAPDTPEDDAAINLLGRWRRENTPPQNVWLGTSVEDQARADERIPLLIEIPAKIRFLSCEPLLGQVDLSSTMLNNGRGSDGKIHWVIAGGEYGPKARPMLIDWASLLLDQCQLNDVAFLFKQWGEHDEHGNRVGKSKAGRLLDGREWNEFPEGGQS